jgi:methylglyoxal synthase
MKKLNIALVAHDARKQELIDWCRHNAEWLSQHNLYGTGTTAKLISKIVTNHELEDSLDSIELGMPLRHITPLLSGPLGGDQQIGAMIAEGKIDVLIFFCDNLITQGHQQDVGALSRLASLYNIAFATNRTTADMIITSNLIMDSDYERIIPNAINTYRNRSI